MTITPRERIGHLISEISEDDSCAAWHDGIEHRVWALLTGAIDPADFDGRSMRPNLPLLETRLGELRALVEDTDGWWTWPPDGDSEFVSLERWRELYAPPFV